MSGKSLPKSLLSSCANACRAITAETCKHEAVVKNGQVVHTLESLFYIDGFLRTCLKVWYATFRVAECLRTLCRDLIVGLAWSSSCEVQQTNHALALLNVDLVSQHNLYCVNLAQRIPEVHGLSRMGSFLDQMGLLVSRTRLSSCPGYQSSCCLSHRSIVHSNLRLCRKLLRAIGIFLDRLCPTIALSLVCHRRGSPL